MNKFLIVLKHTIASTIKSKSFLFTTAIMTVLVGVVFNLPTFISYFESKDADKEIRIGIVDQTKQVIAPLKIQLEEFGFQQITLVELANEEEGISKISDGTIKSLLIVDKEAQGNLNATYKAPQINESGIVEKLQQGLNQLQIKLKANTLGLSEEQVTQLFQPVLITKIPLAEGAKTEEELVQSQVLVYILLFAIYFGVIMYGNMVATEVAKEKSTRVMEILVSSVNPITQMFGKIFGIALVGLLQTVILLSVGYISMMFGEKTVDLGDMVVDFSVVSVSTIAYAIVFYILGYLLFATLAAMLGSLISRVEDLQQTITPLNFMIIAAFMIAMFGLNNPDSSIIVITSYIPFFTPMIMFLRVGVGTPAQWEVVLSIGILILTIIALGIFAAKIYRGGVLMYGKNSNFKSIRYAMSLYKKQNNEL